MAKKKNPNDTLLKNVGQLSNEVAWKDYKHNNAFAYLCKLTPNPDREEIIITHKADEKKMQIPCVYIMVINGVILKIGVAAGTKNKGGFAGRVGSYNCGKTQNRIAGTASTTNYWLLQSLLRMGVECDIYAIYSKPHISHIFGEDFTDWIPSPKGMEGVIISQFERDYGKKPIGNVQR